MIKKFLITLSIIIFSLNANANPIVSGISTNEINIDSDFKGAKILLFGAKGDAGDIVVSLRGPKKSFLVTQRQKFLGVWYNGKRVKFDNSYSFYSLFSTFNKRNDVNAIDNLLSELELGKNNLIFETPQDISLKEENNFKVQLIDQLEKQKLYSATASKVEFLDETLFKVTLTFPQNIVRGVYSVEIYLISDGGLISFQSIPIYVNQTGFSGQVLDFAYKQPFLYGMLAVILALIIGWSTNYLFNRFVGK